MLAHHCSKLRRPLASPCCQREPMISCTRAVLLTLHLRPMWKPALPLDRISLGNLAFTSPWQSCPSHTDRPDSRGASTCTAAPHTDVDVRAHMRTRKTSRPLGLRSAVSSAVSLHSRPRHVNYFPARGPSATFYFGESLLARLGLAWLGLATRRWLAVALATV